MSLKRKVSAAWRVALVLALASFSIALAHARLLRSEPAPSAVLGTPPQEIKLYFDEPVELGFSEVQTLDANRTRVDLGELKYPSDDHKSLSAGLQPLSDGTYTVVWRALSAADGHITRGVFAFSVGNTAGPVIAPIAEGGNGVSETSPVSIVARWINLLATMALVGGFFFQLGLLERGLNALGLEAPLLHENWRRLTLAAFVLALGSALVGLLAEAGAVADVPLWRALAVGPLSQTLFGTHFGALWIARNGLVLLLGVFYLQSNRWVRFGLPALASIALVTVWGMGYPQLLGGALSGQFLNSPTFWNEALGPSGWLHHVLLFGVFPVFFGIAATQRPGIRQAIAIVGGATILLTYSLGGHSDAISGDLSVNVLADWMHLLAGALWVGGLFHFFWAVRSAGRALEPGARARWIAWMVPQFSIQAITATAVIALTGLLSTLFQVGTLNALLTSQYGQTLMLKVALFVVMVGFGAINLLWLSPRFRETMNAPERSGKVFSRFRVTVSAEALLGAAVLFLAGLLTLEPPARSTPGDQGPAPVAKAVYLQQDLAPDVRVELTVQPDLRPVDFDARVSNPQTGAPLEDILRVIFQFTLLNQDVGITTVNSEARPAGHYTVTGNVMPLEGMWRVRVTVRRRGIEDVAAEFPLMKGDPGAGATDPAALELLRESDAAMNALTAVRVKQVLNDGTNGALVTDYAYHAPNAMQFKVEGGTESVAVGPVQYYRNADGTWSARPRIDPLVFPNFKTATETRNVTFGRPETLNGQEVQILRYDIPAASGGESTQFAAWIARADKRLLQFAMNAPSHYMMQYYWDYNGEDVAVVAPANVQTPTPAPMAVNIPAGPPTAGGASGGRVTRPAGPITGDAEADAALGVLVTGILVGILSGDRKRKRNLRLGTLGVSLLLMATSIYLFTDAVNAQSAAANTPVDTNAANAGQQLYEQNCLACHGVTGHGDGPAAGSLATKPFDLTVHIPQHDEQYAFQVITNGRGDMPSFKNKLTPEQIYQIISYTRVLAFKARGSGPGFTPGAPVPITTPKP